MRIESFHARNFRSLRDVRIDGMGPHVVLYGPNGSGKSNLLAGLERVFGLVATRAAAGEWDRGESMALPALAEWVGPDDFFAGRLGSPLALGARIVPGPGETGVFEGDWIRLPSIEVEVEVEPASPGFMVRWTRLAAGGFDLRALGKGSASPALPQALRPRTKTEPPPPGGGDRVYSEAYRFLVDRLPRLFWAVPAVRGLIHETSREESPRFHRPPGPGEVVRGLLWANRLKEALFRAQSSPDGAIRAGFKALADLLAGPPLHRPPFDPIHDPTTGLYDLRESCRAPGGGRFDLPIEQAGLGVVQVYVLLAGVLLGGARCVALEEPEAHLHAPDTGRHLRQLLLRAVGEGHVDQLFVATHSNLFDLDETGFFDVRLDSSDGGTRIDRCESLAELDKHFWEPGPARRALEDHLRFLPEGEVAFRTGEGESVTVGEMIRMLHADDEVAREFLDDVHAAAVRAVRVRSRTSGNG